MCGSGCSWVLLSVRGEVWSGDPGPGCVGLRGGPPTPNSTFGTRTWELVEDVKEPSRLGVMLLQLRRILCPPESCREGPDPEGGCGRSWSRPAPPLPCESPPTYVLQLVWL